MCNDVPSGSETITTSAMWSSLTWAQEEQADALFSFDDSKLFCTPFDDGTGGESARTERTSRKLSEISSSCAAARALSNSDAC